MRRPFPGGVHLPEDKACTAGSVPVPLPGPKQVIISMLQHIGVACEALVKPGDRVKAGQKIGDGEGLCVPVHASVSGRVIAVEPRPCQPGGNVLSVVIENDFQNTPAERAELPEEPTTLFREMGIVGMGGAAFPSFEKFRAAQNGLDTLIGNGCECESRITADDALMQAWPERVVRGLEVLEALLHPRRVVLAVEDNKSRAIAALRPHLAEKKIELAVLPTRYPQGAERQLIRAVTGRELTAGQLPMEAGCLVFNVATLTAMGRAADLHEPLIRRVVTVTGDSVKTPQNFLVPIGTPFREVIAATGAMTAQQGEVLAGGPMTGTAVKTLEVPVLKGTGAIVCTGRVPELLRCPVCIHCGKCVQVCPVHLQPLYLYRSAQREDWPALRRLRLHDCIGCGCCSYICPGHLPLVEQFRQTRKKEKEGKAS